METQALQGHTPGPWRPDDRWIWADTEPFEPVAQANLLRHHTSDVVRANAVLMALAPEMLKMLQEIAGRSPRDIITTSRLGEIRELIRRATNA